MYVRTIDRKMHRGGTRAIVHCPDSSLAARNQRTKPTWGCSRRRPIVPATQTAHHVSTHTLQEVVQGELRRAGVRVWVFEHVLSRWTPCSDFIHPGCYHRVTLLRTLFDELACANPTVFEVAIRKLVIHCSLLHNLESAIVNVSHSEDKSQADVERNVAKLHETHHQIEAEFKVPKDILLKPLGKDVCVALARGRSTRWLLIPSRAIDAHDDRCQSRQDHGQEEVTTEHVVAVRTSVQVTSVELPHAVSN